MTRSRFFCENCGTEVRPHAKVCPNCGRFFSAVRCPSCGYTGEGKEFVRGCPNCGYSGGAGRGERAGEQWFDLADLEAQDTELTSASRPRSSRPARTRSAPPGWAYWLALGLITLVFIAMVIIYVRLS